MNWKRSVLYGAGGVMATFVLLGWMLFEGVFDPPRPRPALTSEQRQILHPNTVAGFDAYIADDFHRALSLLTPRAEADDPEAQFWLARMYDFGYGVQQDRLIANVWYRRSVDLGHPISMYNLAFSYDKGEGVNGEPAMAFSLWQRAAKLGYAKAQYMLARAYRNGRGVPSNPTKAAVWLTSAAEQRHIWAMGALATLYFNGEGVKRNRMRAFMWNYIASGFGNIRATITSPLYWFFTTRSQREEAKRHADAWLLRF
jgi:uncharacterized protein